MTDITTRDSFRGRLQTFLQERPPAPRPQLPLLYSSATTMAPTFIVSRVDGGVGASMLTLMLSLYLSDQPLIIQVGGMKSWAYRELSDGYFIHVKPGEEEDSMAAPLDHRLQHGDRVAIIEYEQALPVEAIGAANFIANELSAYSLLLLIADKHDREFKLLETAKNQGVERVIGLRKFSLMPRAGEPLLQIPTVPGKIAAKLQTQPSSFAYHMRALETPVATMNFQNRLNAFFAQIVGRMQ